MKSTEIFTVKAVDNYDLNVKIDYPDEINGIIIFSQGSGANTYDNHRKIGEIEFNYFDLFADEFCKRGIAFCRWNTRGCSISDPPLNYVAINERSYETYCPSTSMADIISVADFVRGLAKFHKAKIIFMELVKVQPLPL